MIVKKVISGGQTGADQAGLRAAKYCKIKTGGYAPRGYLTELGPKPKTLKSYGLVEHKSDKYPPRTAANIHSSDCTIIIAKKLDTGSGLTAKLCLNMKRPYLHLTEPNNKNVSRTVKWLVKQFNKKKSPIVLNVAGNRESKSAGLQVAATKFLVKVFKELQKLSETDDS